MMSEATSQKKDVRGKRQTSASDRRGGSRNPLLLSTAVVEPSPYLPLLHGPASITVLSSSDCVQGRS
jgi:hypothetical protein